MQQLATIQQKTDILNLIPKTIVYFELIANQEAAREYLVAWLQKLGNSMTVTQTVARIILMLD